MQPHAQARNQNASKSAQGSVTKRNINNTNDLQPTQIQRKMEPTFALSHRMHGSNYTTAVGDRFVEEHQRCVPNERFGTHLQTKL